MGYPAAMGYRRCRAARPGVPEPPRCRSRRSPPGTDPPRCRGRRSRSRRRRSPLLPALSRCLPLPRAATAGPGRGGGGGCVLPAPLPGGRGPGLRLREGPRSPPPPPPPASNPCCSGGSGLIPPSPPRRCNPPPPAPNLCSCKVCPPPRLFSCGCCCLLYPRSPLPSTPLHLRAPLCSYQSSYHLPYNLCFQGCCWQDAPSAAFSPTADTQPHPSSVSPRGRGTPCPSEAVFTSLSPCNKDSPPPPPRPDHLCCGKRLLCPGLCSWSKQDPKLRAGQDAKGARGRGGGHRATPPCKPAGSPGMQ
ncbi:WAS/WASL-interacting protein family member 1-like [Aquila chrysaetos chrysaetos]|uniref:WAS/WASL-interacting protein family member 1-like n=1 Tax=Aquila chrysaetos chrysaetos TaxID=223781 RepID=UPI00117691AF|nr:WAS/WASL-interacting protein family member 1-like [Aquila chrysaetos chrysaetos]